MARRKTGQQVLRRIVLLPLIILLGPAFLAARAPGGSGRAEVYLARREVLLTLPLVEAALRSDAAAAESLTGKKVVVLGGSGFVGRRICEGLLQEGATVVSVSRSGRPAVSEDWVGQVKWEKGDLLSSNLAPFMEGAEAVISAVGAIGSGDDERLNGQSNERAAAAAKAAKAKRFVLVSASKDVAEAGVDALFGPYIQGKRRAEAATEQFDEKLILQPSFIYGGEEFSATPPRVAGWYGEKVESLLSTDLFRAAAGASPAALRLALSPPLDVKDVAGAAVAGAAGRARGTLGNHDAILAAARG